jgi:hypothetical protein
MVHTTFPGCEVNVGRIGRNAEADGSVSVDICLQMVLFYLRGVFANRLKYK